MKFNYESFEERELKRMNKVTDESQFNKTLLIQKKLKLERELEDVKKHLESLDIIDDYIILENIDDYHDLWKKRYGLNG